MVFGSGCSFCGIWDSDSESRSVISDSLQPHELEPAKLLCLWNFPGKNTGVGYLSLLQGIFPTQGLNPCLTLYRHILYHLSHQGSQELGYYAIKISTVVCIQIAIHTDTQLYIQRRGERRWFEVEPKEVFRVGFARCLLEGQGGLQEISILRVVRKAGPWKDQWWYLFCSPAPESWPEFQEARGLDPRRPWGPGQRA